ncbi:MAG: rod shape-determining protein RodA [Candidatus Pacebacteria bacterium]|nr:rod shape-determining protein RodA [Candidatus Paceibacterota bacterium]
MRINYIKKIDKVLFLSVVFLIIIGLMAIFSVSYSGGEAAFLNFKKQLLFALFGTLLCFLFASIDYRVIKNYTGIIYIVMATVLLIVLFLGSSTRGTSSWFSVGLFGIQPSEFAKIVLIIVLAKYFSEVGSSYNLFKKILVSGFYTAIPVSLVIFQPDLGSSLVMIFIWFAMLAVFGLKKKQILILFFLGIAVSVASWTFVLKDYQKDRINTFINPQSDPLGSGYNVIQSKIAIGSGNIWGKGLGHGSQSQLNFLPEKHTDFIFAVIAEEMGLVGGVLVIFLFAVVFYRLFLVAEEAQDNFGKLIVLGAAFMLFFHFLINVGMNMGIMPVTGIPLPFVSYGGSSLISFMIIIGIVQSVYINGRRYRFDKESDSL